MPSEKQASRRAQKRRTKAESRIAALECIFGERGSSPEPDAPPVCESTIDMWVAMCARAMELTFDGPVFWGKDSAQQLSGYKFLDGRSKLVVFFLAGHIWYEGDRTFVPMVADYVPDANVPCGSLRDACVTNYDFEKHGFAAT
eukprot:jgi/Tetstr1/454064/TSEL_040983.t1